MYPNIQAYDRGVMFSPDGRLFQVEYAREAVKKGATAVGIVAEDGVVIAAHRNINEALIVPETLQKIFKIDPFIGSTYSGMVSDGLHLVNMMREKTQSHRMIYDETEPVETLAREMAEEMLTATEYGGLRPFAVTTLIGGYDTKPRLFEVDPAGALAGYKADAIGSGKKIAEEILAKEYKDNMKMDDAIKLCVSIIKKINENNLTSDNIEISTTIKSKGYKFLSPKEIEAYI